MPKYMGGLGFRDIELFNLAMLARQGWRLLQNPESLSARVLKAVYFPEVDLLRAELGSRPSQIWRGIIAGLDILEQGLIKRVGDGSSINIWSDNWLPRDFKLKPICPITTAPPQIVSDLILPHERKQNLDLLTEHLLPADVEAVLKIPISFVEQRDYWAWHYERTGYFTVWSAYKMIVETKYMREAWLEGRDETSNTTRTRNDWKKLWGASVPSKLRVFAWRLARASLPTGEERCRRHMVDEPVCTICNAAVDSWRHSLLNCNMARCV